MACGRFCGCSQTFSRRQPPLLPFTGEGARGADEGLWLLGSGFFFRLTLAFWLVISSAPSATTAAQIAHQPHFLRVFYASPAQAASIVYAPQEDDNGLIGVISPGVRACLPPCPSTDAGSGRAGRVLLSFPRFSMPGWLALLCGVVVLIAAAYLLYAVLRPDSF